jgi:hypothetical protein
VTARLCNRQAHSACRRSAAGPPHSFEFCLGISIEASYSAAGQMLYMGGQSFAYNARGQVTSFNGTAITYGAQNDGRALSVGNAKYTYDSLGRLKPAATAGPEWDRLTADEKE